MGLTFPWARLSSWKCRTLKYCKSVPNSLRFCKSVEIVQHFESRSKLSLTLHQPEFSSSFTNFSCVSLRNSPTLHTIWDPLRFLCGCEWSPLLWTLILTVCHNLLLRSSKTVDIMLRYSCLMKRVDFLPWVPSGRKAAWSCVWPATTPWSSWCLPPCWPAWYCCLSPSQGQTHTEPECSSFR